MIGITAHLPLRSHQQKLCKGESAECRACVEDEETLEHYLCEYLGFSRLSRDVFHGSQCFNFKEILHLV